MRALVTGAGGFAGQWLCAELLSDGWDVHGATLTGAPAGGTLEPWQRDAIMWHDADLRDADDVAAALDAARPDAVFHLAGVSFVPDAGADPGAAWSTNVLGAVCLLDAIAVRRQSGVIDPVVIVAGSGEEYGPHSPAELPLIESAELRPHSAYAATKVAQEFAALANWRATGTRVIATRPFNHSGPGQASSFLLPALVRRALDAQQAGADTIRVGNPEPVRDFLNVSDVARAYLFLALRGRAGEVYNIASGFGVSVGELAAMVLKQVRHDARVISDPALVRPVDVPALIGDASKLTADTTWRPKADLEMLIDDLIDAATN